MKHILVPILLAAASLAGCAPSVHSGRLTYSGRSSNRASSSSDDSPAWVDNSSSSSTDNSNAAIDAINQANQQAASDAANAAAQAQNNAAQADAIQTMINANNIVPGP